MSSQNMFVRGAPSGLKDFESNDGFKRRGHHFVEQFMDAIENGNLTFEIHIGIQQTEDGRKKTPAVIVVVNGRPHGFTSREARDVADAAEKTMNDLYKIDGQKELLEPFPDLIMGLREGAKDAETHPEIVTELQQPHA